MKTRVDYAGELGRFIPTAVGIVCPFNPARVFSPQTTQFAWHELDYFAGWVPFLRQSRKCGIGRMACGFEPLAVGTVLRAGTLPMIGTKGNLSDVRHSPTEGHIS